MNTNSTNLLKSDAVWLIKNLSLKQNEDSDLPYFDEFDKIKKELKFSKDELIFKEGTLTNGFYLIIKGKVKLVKDYKSANENILFILIPGNILGLNSTINGQIAFTSAIALEDVTALFFSKEKFQKIPEKFPQIYLKLMETTINKIEKMENRMLEMSQSSSVVRLAKTLLMLNEVYGIENEKVINLSIDHSDIAKLVNVNQTTLYRLMKEFKDKKLIRYRGNRLVITDLKKLTKVAFPEKHL